MLALLSCVVTATLIGHVGQVLILSPDEKMIGIHTERRVAVVKDVELFRDRTDEQLVCDPVSSLVLATDVEVAVLPLGTRCSSPDPTTRACIANLVEEPESDFSHGGHGRHYTTGGVQRHHFS